jgi:CBS-domain-containing membrane protein
MNVGKEFNKANNHQLHTFFSSYFIKMKGEKKSEANVKVTDSIISATGGLIAMIIISAVAVMVGFPMVLGPMGASCLLIFAAHAGPFSQPRHIMGGHFIATITALTIWDIFGRSHVTMAITLAVVLFLMLILKMVHPPAAASAMVAINTQAGWGFLLTIVICSLILLAISVFYNNLFKERQYPKQWF